MFTPMLDLSPNWNERSKWMDLDRYIFYDLKMCHRFGYLINLTEGCIDSSFNIEPIYVQIMWNMLMRLRKNLSRTFTISFCDKITFILSEEVVSGKKTFQIFEKDKLVWQLAFSAGTELVDYFAKELDLVWCETDKKWKRNKFEIVIV